jgi:hypothetical protein
MWYSYFRIQGSISSTFYEQLKHEKIPRVQKKQSSHQCLFELLGYLCAKDVHKTLVKSTTVVNFINILHVRFLYESAFNAKILSPKPKCNFKKAAQSTFV